MVKEFRPMLAATPTKPIKFPVFASPKIDGIRIIVKDGRFLSRTLKEIPNKYIQDFLQTPCDFYNDGSLGSEMAAENFVYGDHLEGLDGEITVGAANNHNVMQETMSGVMSESGCPAWTIYAFDLWNREASYLKRYEELSRMLDPACRPPRINILKQELIESEEELLAYEQYCLKLGFEGVVIRNPLGKYKYGRSTENEGYLIKIKRFEDAEAEIIGFKQMQRNQNEAVTDALGLTKRSTKAEGMVLVDMLGAFLMRTPEGEEFSLSGFTNEERIHFWNIRESLVGRFAKYKHFANSGVVNAPRNGVFLGFRDQLDI